MKTTIFKLKPLSTKTKIIISKEIVINLKLTLLSMIITLLAFIVFYFTLKPNKQEIQTRITIEQERIADSIANIKKQKNIDFLKHTLQVYVETANNPKYNGNFDIINSKFPELKGYDKTLLEEYVATANNEKYNGDFNVINSKFPEFFNNFEKKDNIKTYRDGTDIYDIPINEVGGFLKEYPNAELIESDKILTTENILKFTEIEYVKQLNSFHKNLKDKTLFTIILSLFGLILGRYFYKITNIALKQLILLVKAIKKYSKMDL